MRTVTYVLQNVKTGKLATVCIESNNGANFCGSHTYTLSSYEDYPVWEVDSKEKAEFARMNSTSDYNSSEETPTHCVRFDSNEYVVAECVKVHTITPVEVFLPNYEEYWALKLNKSVDESDKRRIESILSDYQKDKLKMNPKKLTEKYYIFLSDILSILK